MKKIAVPFVGPTSYTYKGEKYTCEEHASCLVSGDAFRAHFAYGEAFVFATFQTKLPDGTILGIAMQDGIGADHSDDDRATEDFITVNGKAYKLDQTEFKFD